MNLTQHILPNILKWKECRFRYLATTSKGKLPSKSEDLEEDAEPKIPYLSMEYLRGFDEPSTLVSSQGMIVAQDNDIILLWDGSNAGEFLRAKFGGISSTAALVKPLKLERSYLYWLCKAAEPILKTFTNGMGIPHVDAEFLNNLRLPSPDQAELRQAIVKYLDHETSHIDSLVMEKQRMLSLLEEKRAALISSAVTRGLNFEVPLKSSGLDWLGDIPVHWDVCRLKFISENLDQGSSPVASNSPANPDELGILKLSAVSKGRFKRNENKALKESEGNEEILSLRKGDILITRGNTPDLVADVACVSNDEPNLLLPDLIYRLRVRLDQVLPEFLTYFLTTQAARVQIRRDARGSSGTMVKVSQGHVLDWQMPLPPMPEQVAITNQIISSESRFQSIMEQLSMSISLLVERRDALIISAVTGQIAPEEMTV